MENNILIEHYGDWIENWLILKRSKFVLKYYLKKSSVLKADCIRNAVSVCIAVVNCNRIIMISINKGYKMGTIGEAEGEKITLAFEYATKHKLPIVCFVSSAGIRIQEGALALIQMAKMGAAVKLHNNRKLLFISIVQNPTLGGASASFVSLADIIIAEKDSIYGFAGRRIIEKTTSECLPPNFQTSEYSKMHGFVDIVVDGAEIKNILLTLFKLHSKRS